MIIIKNVRKELKKKTVLDNINLKLQPGKMYLVKGHNGCGKTMLLRLICGLIKPTSGEIHYDMPCSFGVIIENPSFIDTESGLWNLKFLAKINNVIDDGKIEEVLRMIGLQGVENEKVKNYSLGMKQRLAISQAIMEDQNVILLDEPFNALDEESYLLVIKILNELREEGKLIVIAAHNVEREADLKIDEEICMSEGVITKILKREA